MDKAAAGDFLGRCREVVSNPLNLLIQRCETAGEVQDGLVTLHNGNRVPVAGPDAYYEDFSKILVINRGVHEPLEEYVFQQVLRTLRHAPVMLELGAYWSHYSMWLKRVRPSALTHMVDANIKNLASGRENFQRNNLAGDFFLLASAGHIGACLRVDDFLASRQLRHLDILHADVEGDECSVLAGCAGALRDQRIAFVFVATHSQQLHQQALSLLMSHGYRIEVSADFDRETTSHDGFIFASASRLASVFMCFVPPTRAWLTTASPTDLLNALFEIPQ